ncbi:MAG: L,D-transpeptidase family protein [Simkania sp.]|nr:L,D-transpeptidase family protein [Simkania sp.]
MIPSECLQLIVTLVPAEDACIARLCTYEYAGNSWHRVFGPCPVVIGRSGLTWDKKEGDGKTPSGVFPLLQVFGRKEHKTQTMPFIEVHHALEAIDDPSSMYYNQIIDRNTVTQVDWKSSEKMAEVGDLYDLGVVVGYNTPSPVAGKGSCIFLHNWRSASQGTAGCTAMSPEVLRRCVFLLDKTKNPHIVQVSAQEAWRLPVEARSP